MSILMDAKHYYNDFFVNGVWNDAGAVSSFKEYYTSEKRVFFKTFYDSLFKSKVLNELTRIYIVNKKL